MVSILSCYINEQILSKAVRIITGDNLFVKVPLRFGESDILAIRFIL